MKTHKIIIFIFIVIAFTTCITVRKLPIWLFDYSNKWKWIVEDFNDYESDFNNVVETLSAFLPENDSEKIVYVVYDRESNHNCLKLDNRQIELSEKTQNSLDKIAINAFKSENDSVLDVIRLKKDRIEFEIESGYYKLVYSIDDSEPKYLHFQNENENISLKKVKKHWYHVVKNPD